MNVNDSKVYTDCVEDIDTPLSDICFNEDLYTRPPTVEFTVVRSTADVNKETTDVSSSKDTVKSNSNPSWMNTVHRANPTNTYTMPTNNRITPEDLNLPDSIWISGRDRQIFVGSKGKAYYLSDNGKIEITYKDFDIH